jgi:hypothetical protein
LFLAVQAGCFTMSGRRSFLSKAAMFRFVFWPGREEVREANYSHCSIIIF